MSAHRLSTGVVLEPGPSSCVVVTRGSRTTVAYAAPFASRATELRPGHLVALAPGKPSLVLWRWFDAVVLEVRGDAVRLWEPAHGEVTAQARRPGQRVGGRSYLSAGLPGAQWWVAGPADHPGTDTDGDTDADVELDEVAAFYDEHGLWERLAP